MIARLAYLVCTLRGHDWRRTRFASHAHTLCHRCGAAAHPDAVE